MNNNIQQYNQQPSGQRGNGFDMTRLIMTLAVMYFVNPIDLPGPLDDAGVMFLAMFLIGVLGMFKGGGQ